MVSLGCSECNSLEIKDYLAVRREEFYTVLFFLSLASVRVVVVAVRLFFGKLRFREFER